MSATGTGDMPTKEDGQRIGGWLLGFMAGSFMQVAGITKGSLTGWHAGLGQEVGEQFLAFMDDFLTDWRAEKEKGQPKPS